MVVEDDHGLKMDYIVGETCKFQCLCIGNSFTMAFFIQLLESQMYCFVTTWISSSGLAHSLIKHYMSTIQE